MNLIQLELYFIQSNDYLYFDWTEQTFYLMLKSNQALIIKEIKPILT